METTPAQDAKISNMTFSSVYPHYLAKVEKKGRTKKELHQVIEWLTGYNEPMIAELSRSQVTFKEFFEKAQLNEQATLITGVICGYRIENISDPVTRQVRYLDKLVDELAKGRKIEKILRTKA